MADNSVEIKFDASIDGLLSGVEQVKAAISSITDSIQPVAASAKELGETVASGFAGGKSNTTAAAQNAASGVSTIYRNLQGQLTSTWQAGASQQVQIEQDKTAQVKEKNNELLKSQVSAIQARIRAQSAAYASEVEQINMLARTFQISEREKTQMLLVAVSTRVAAIESEAKRGMELTGQSGAQFRQFQNELTKAAQKGEQDRRKIEDQAAIRDAQTWKSAADQIAGAFNSQLRGLLAGTTSWSTAMKKISGDLILKLIEDQVKLELEWLASQARILAASISAEASKTAATETGTAARAAAETSAGQISILSVIANALKSIFASAGQTGAEVSAAVAPEAGPAAPAIGAGAAASVVASSIATAKFAIGTDYILNSGLAFIHKGEAIVPEMARGTGPYTGRGLGGGAQIHAPVNISLSALDRQSVARFFSDNKSELMKAIRDSVRSGAHLGLRQSGLTF